MDEKKNIAFVVMTHGDERIGQELFINYPYGQTDFTTWQVIVANPRAWELGVRYVDTDLNRLFHGEKRPKAVGGTASSYEMARAKWLYDALQPYSNVYDIHQYMGGMKDKEPMLFINNKDEETLDSISYLPYEKIVVDSPPWNSMYVTSVKSASVCVEYPKTTYSEDKLLLLRDFFNVIHRKAQNVSRSFYRSIRGVSWDEARRRGYNFTPWEPVEVDGHVYYPYLVAGTGGYSGYYCFLAELEKKA